MAAEIEGIYKPARALKRTNCSVMAMSVTELGLNMLIARVLPKVGLKGTHDEGWRLLLGVIDIGLGTYLVISGPLAGLAFVAAIIGFSFLFRGVFLISLAFGLRRLKSA
ncbi:hypothetical protein HHL08_24145 [Sphingobium sp. AR-3-1]|uniref:Uncharacterized protein n=1 Tax=Sphingobium psychrophilum TaxID=2728834 RepID=A0A7X9X0G9_9SPHN|nr:hypothetical protein [Sphingobium psychrophilum]NML13175.1 hypothetical protein [Sphingobium psychrophilum]